MKNNLEIEVFDLQLPSLMIEPIVNEVTKEYRPGRSCWSSGSFKYDGNPFDIVGKFPNFKFSCNNNIYELSDLVIARNRDGWDRPYGFTFICGGIKCIALQNI